MRFVLTTLRTVAHAFLLSRAPKWTQVYLWYTSAVRLRAGFHPGEQLRRAQGALFELGEPFALTALRVGAATTVGGGLHQPCAIRVELVTRKLLFTATTQGHRLLSSAWAVPGRVDTPPSGLQDPARYTTLYPKAPLFHVLARPQNSEQVPGVDQSVLQFQYPRVRRSTSLPQNGKLACATMRFLPRDPKAYPPLESG